MIKKLKELALLIATLTVVAVPVAVPSMVAADTVTDSLCQGVTSVTGGGGCSAQSDNSGLNKILTLVINIFSFIVGFVAVLMIIIGGFKYITSGGDSNNISSAKNTLIYALVGLVIVVLAQVLVRFVINRTLTATS